MAQREPIVIKSGIPTIIGTDTLRANLDAHAGLTTSGLASGDVVQVSGALTLGKAVNTSTSPIIGVYDGVSGSVVKEGVVVATFKTGPTTAGEAVYLSSTAGQLTNVKPSADMLHEVGVVVDVPSKKVLLQQKPVIALPVTPPVEVWVGAATGAIGYSRFLASDGSYLTRWSAPLTPNGMVWTGTHLWGAYFNDTGLVKLNPDATLAGGPYSIDSRAYRLAYDGAYIYVPSRVANAVYKVDPATGSVVATFTPGATPSGFACCDGAGNVWVTSSADNNIRKIRTSDGVVVGTYATSIISNSGITTDGVYMYSAGETGGGAGRVCKFLISTGALSGPYDTGGSWAFDITYDPAGYVWTGNVRSGTLAKLRCSDGALFGPYSVGAQWTAEGVSCSGAHVWASDPGNDRVRKYLAADGSLVGNYGNSSNADSAKMVCSTFRVGVP